MCGIVGYFGFDEDGGLLERMNDAIAHRGPDGSGYYTDVNIGLAHRRLSIIDKKLGSQPMRSSDGSLIISYNGEVYNYLSLRKGLAESGLEFKTNSDTEVVLNAYKKWGEKSFDDFNGMFAFALYDKDANKLILARDHFGIKPLYYANLGTNKKPKILFASEIKAILASGLVDKKPNDEVVYRYLKYRIHDDDDQTFFKGIYRVNPGQMLILDKNGLKKRQFSNLEQELLELSKKSKTKYSTVDVDEYRELLTESIRLRLQSEVPVGTSLSGGLDSSSVATIINKLMNEHNDSSFVSSVGPRQNTFSAIFPNSLNDEEKYVDACLSNFKDNVQSHKIKPNTDQFISDMEEFVKIQEEPLISTGPYAQYCVMREAAKSVTVLLDGQGADEMMAGYAPYYFVYFNQLKKSGQWAKLIFEILFSGDVLFRLVRFSLKDRLSFRKQVDFSRLLNASFVESHKGSSFKVVNDNIKQRLVQDIFHNSLPSLLRYEDKNTMNFSIEGRVPFIDKEAVKYLFGLSDEAIIKGSWNKRVLRDAMQGMLPDIINRRRNKIGFTTPEPEWFVKLKDVFYDIFTSKQFASRPYFNQIEVVRAYKDYMDNKNDIPSMTFWRLINLELWMRQYFDEDERVKDYLPKSNFVPNVDKKLDISVGEETYRRYPIKTKAVQKDDELEMLVKEKVVDFFDSLSGASDEHRSVAKNKWYFFISEKIVAITQKRSFFIWDIQPRLSARILSRFVTRTNYGIGLADPCTMELAIKEAGLARVLGAAIVGFLGKLIGKRGLFYILVGGNIRAIDGPTEYSVFPSNVSAKLPPKKPNLVAKRLSTVIKESIPKEYVKNFAGVIIMDANDIGRNVLGSDVNEPERLFEDIFADNPLGQSSEQTPIAIVFRK